MSVYFARHNSEHSTHTYIRSRNKQIAEYFPLYKCCIGNFLSLVVSFISLSCIAHHAQHLILQLLHPLLGRPNGSCQSLGSLCCHWGCPSQEVVAKDVFERFDIVLGDCQYVLVCYNTQLELLGDTSLFAVTSFKWSAKVRLWKTALQLAQQDWGKFWHVDPWFTHTHTHTIYIDCGGRSRLGPLLWMAQENHW